MHPQRKPAAFFDPHHQSPAAVITESNTENRRCRKKGFQNRNHTFRIHLIKQALRHPLLSVGIQKDAILFLHTANIDAGPLPGSLLQKQRKRRIYTFAEQGMYHNLRVAGLIPEMLHKNRLIVRQAIRCLDLSFNKASRQISGRIIQPKPVQHLNQASFLTGLLQFMVNTAKSLTGTKIPSF